MEAIVLKRRVIESKKFNKQFIVTTILYSWEDQKFTTCKVFERIWEEDDKYEFQKPIGADSKYLRHYNPSDGDL
jgi:hypothetical protein